MRDTKINIIVSFIMGGVISVGIYGLNRIYVWCWNRFTYCGNNFFEFWIGYSDYRIYKEK